MPCSTSTSEDGKVSDYRYKLLPVFANLLPADAEMSAYITQVRAPFAARLSEKLATTEGLLYRRGNFNGTFDQLICDALMQVRGAEIAFSPGFRWGTSLLPGQTILMEHLMDQTAITYPYTTVNELSGAMIKTILEDVADNLFNPDPYLQQGGDMVRVGGLQYSIDPLANIGHRISDMRLGGKPLDADKSYKVAGWAPVAEGAKGQPIWEVVATYMKDRKVLKPQRLNLPAIKGAAVKSWGSGSSDACRAGVRWSSRCCCRPRCCSAQQRVRKIHLHRSTICAFSQIRLRVTKRRC